MLDPIRYHHPNARGWNRYGRNDQKYVPDEPERREMTVRNELIDSLLADYKKPEDLLGESGLLKQLTKRLVERALQAEMAQHLGHAKGDSVANAAGNTRNGTSKKTLKGEFGELPLEIPRDRHGSFDPQIITKH